MSARRDWAPYGRPETVRVTWDIRAPIADESGQVRGFRTRYVTTTERVVVEVDWLRVREVLSPAARARLTGRVTMASRMIVYRANGGLCIAVDRLSRAFGSNAVRSRSGMVKWRNCVRVRWVGSEDATATRAAREESATSVAAWLAAWRSGIGGGS